MSDMKLTDLIDVSLLQRLLNTFSNMTGFATYATDEEGRAITEGFHFTRFCTDFNRKSEIGLARCEECARIGAKCSLETGKAEIYTCHVGLTNFAVPIMVGDVMVGCFIGGQTLTEAPLKQYSDSIAKQIEVDPEAYWDALQEIKIIEKKHIHAAADYLFQMASIISDIAYGKFQALESRKEMESVANMKTDFLANMSHEIRTPMNAVIGMAEMALREDLPPVARDYIKQIKSSGGTLLNIINDILDFSKIESGKMNIIPDEYESLSLLHEVSNILMTRIGDKNVELIVSVNPLLPHGIYGDNNRVRQILINLANNAIKFTKQGYVRIDVDFDEIDDENIMLKVSVQDTGIGIAKKDMDKLFKSFQQVDSKRNRNVEGTGLGLAICKKLLELMGGSISVTSEYEKGSNFSFCLPQKVTDFTSCISVKKADGIFAFGYFRKKSIAKSFFMDMKQLNVDAFSLTSVYKFENYCKMFSKEMEGKQILFFTEDILYTEELSLFVEEHPEIRFMVWCSFYSTAKSNIKNVQFIKKPLSTITLGRVLNNDKSSLYSEDVMTEFEFIAPEAKVLIVDDNEINLTVSEGLLKPLKMQVVTTNSGVKALNLLKTERYDIIFMDHMMPELYGVETTRIIRRLHPSLADMPIIALTANAVGGAKNMFLAEGMNDFVAKPIELRTLIAKVRQWLPKEKIVTEKVSETENEADSSLQSVYPHIGDLDTEFAIRMVGSEDLFWKILKKYYDVIQTKSAFIKECEKKEDFETYTIEVHSLKSTSRQIGAVGLSKKAELLEAAGNREDAFLIHEKTDEMLAKYVSYLDVLKPFIPDEELLTQKRIPKKEELKALFEKLRQSSDNLDMDGMESVINDMKHFVFESPFDGYYQQLKDAVENLDVDSCEEISKVWESAL